MRKFLKRRILNPFTGGFPGWLKRSLVGDLSSHFMLQEARQRNKKTSIQGKELSNVGACASLLRALRDIVYQAVSMPPVVLLSYVSGR